QLAPFFDALNFFATKSNKITQTPIVSNTEQDADSSDASTTVDTNVSALPTLFQDTEEPTPAPSPTSPASSSEESTTPTPTPAPNTTTPPSDQSLGDYLRKLLGNLEKSNLPEGTSISISANHQDETYE
ncbi:hypothetical protein, partial [Mesomycoplasma ovipneumoniae]|uniref:hypothetical protein n=1 Tax=Mesomycoplasma ovipneumoniae TaxID=29562 RepID=UPI003080F685